MIKDALDKGFRNISIAIGASATNDGGMGKGAEKIYEFGVESILPTINGAMDIEEALERAEELYQAAADRLFRLIKVGMDVRK